MILKIEKKEIKKSFTCLLCTSLLDHPITISECLHSFCRICIHDKLLTEKLHACPICKVDLGVFPFAKLRADYSLERSMLTLFPPKQETIEATNETIEAFFKSSTKKEKSLSSILGSSARVSVTPDLNLEAPMEPDMVVVKKPSEQVEAVPSIPRLSKPMKTFQKRDRKNTKPKKSFKFNIDLNVGLGNEWDEAGTSQGYIPMENKTEEATVEANKNVILISSDGETEEEDGEKQQMVSTTRLLRPRKGRSAKNNAVLEMNSTAGTSVATIPLEVERNSTVWFSLMASKNQESDRPLPPMARLYLRVTNGNLSVSYVKKYLVKKLNLESEEEVEIWLSHEKVSSSMTLINLVDRWLATKPSKELNTVVVGSSAAEFVMVLNYSRKETTYEFL